MRDSFRFASHHVVARLPSRGGCYEADRRAHDRRHYYFSCFESVDLSSHLRHVAQAAFAESFLTRKNHAKAEATSSLRVRKLPAHCKSANGSRSCSCQLARCIRSRLQLLLSTVHPPRHRSPHCHDPRRTHAA